MTEWDDAPLSGVRVLDLSRVIAGPHCTRMLADLGAQIIKLEPPEGDQTRGSGALGGISATGFVQLNLGKKLISCDLGRLEGQDLVRRLAGTVDVLIENFRPGVMAAWGLNYESLATQYPELIYVSISGYGQSGAWRHRRAYAPYVHAEAGYLDTIAKLKGQAIEHETVSTADLVAAKDATVALLAALWHREHGAGGRHIDVSLAHSILFMNEFASALLTDGAPMPRSGSTPQTIFTTSDGHSFSAGNPVSGQVFPKFCRAFGCPELITDERFADSGSRRTRRAEVIETLQAALSREVGMDELEGRLAAEGLAVGRMRTVRAVVDADWVTERTAVVEAHDEKGRSVRIPSVPWRMSGRTQPAMVGSVATVGADNREVLGSLLGLSDEEIDRLEADGVLTHHVEGAPRPENPS